MKIDFLEDYSSEENINLSDLKYIKKYIKKYKKENKKNNKLDYNYNTKLNIIVDYDENNEKVVFLNFNLKLKNTNKLSFDIGINKDLYFLIGKELFSK
jgi:hypothetical protein